MKEVYVNSEHINTLETFLDLTPIVCGPICLFILLLYKVLVHHLMRICAVFFFSYLESLPQHQTSIKDNLFAIRNSKVLI